VRGGESSEVAYRVRFGGMRLRDAAAQNHARVLTQMRERCIESGSADSDALCVLFEIGTRRSHDLRHSRVFFL
jgi:hypothetical protein